MKTLVLAGTALVLGTVALVGIAVVVRRRKITQRASDNEATRAGLAKLQSDQNAAAEELRRIVVQIEEIRSRANGPEQVVQA